MIASLHLRLPDLSWDGAVGIAKVHDVLAKYDPDEPRDARGRWTTGGEGSGPAAPAPRRRKPVAVGAAGRRGEVSGDTAATDLSPAADSATDHTSSAPWGGVTHLYGGQLIDVQEGPGIGHNGPPEDMELIPEVEPAFEPPRAPQGWDIPGHSIGGLSYPATRIPRLANGEPWVADPETVRDALARQRGRIPAMFIYVPADGIGPMLVGSTSTIDYAQPDGYFRVQFVGTPQRTFSGGIETGHALDGIKEGLRLAWTISIRLYTLIVAFPLLRIASFQAQFVQMWSLLHDQISILSTYFFPYETLSPGQTPEAREPLMPKAPSVAPMRWGSYKVYRRASSKRFGLYQACM